MFTIWSRTARALFQLSEAYALIRSLRYFEKKGIPHRYVYNYGLIPSCLVFFNGTKRYKFPSGKDGYRSMSPTNQALFPVFFKFLIGLCYNFKDGLSFAFCNITIHVYRGDQECCE